jgi:hypothetical protein
MGRALFALGSIAGASVAQLLASAALFVRLPTDDGGMQALGPGILWIGGTIILMVSAPLWTPKIYPRWSGFRPLMIRNLLLLPWVLCLSALGLLGAYTVLAVAT